METPVNDVPSTYEWYEQGEGRQSERSRRITFLVLFTQDGRPGKWLLLVLLLAGLVAGMDVGSF